MSGQGGLANSGPTGALVVPVGGQWRAPLAAIRAVGSRRIVFLVSRDTEKHIADIRQNCTPPPEDVDWIVTPDHESVSETLRVLNDRLPDVLLKWHVDWAELTVDLTGGTKAMVAALMLATIHRSRQFVYVGGVARDRGGTGSVVDGAERPVIFFNPWDETAEDARRQIYWAFNRLQFGTAAALAQRAFPMVTGENKPYLSMLLELVQGFAAWDRFDYGPARSSLRNAHDRLCFAWHRMAGHEHLVPELEKSIDYLNRLEVGKTEGVPARGLLLDLLANAWRRGECERRFDDAVARLYRFIEGLAQRALWDSAELRTGKVPLAALPPGADWDPARQAAAKSGAQTAKLGLTSTYSLLAARGHPLGTVASRMQQGEDFATLLTARNQSLLAHGIDAVGESDFRSLFTVCCEIGGFRQEDLFQFMKLPE